MGPRISDSTGGLTTSIALCFVLIQVFFAGGADAAPDEDEVLTTRRTDTPPIIDGLLTDPAWKDAPSITKLTQTVPVEGATPSEQTIIKILHDSDNLYIGVYAQDSRPDRIVATQMERDRDLAPDDRIELVLDTFLDRRNAYFFQLSPAGSKGDALISGNGNSFDKDYDGIWQGKSTIHENGWSAEFAIPFKTLSFDPDGKSWGFNVVRVIKRKEERARWASPTQNSSLFTIADAGTLTGLSGLEQGVGLDIVPFVAGTFFRDRPESREYLRFDPGFDIFYKITPSLTASLTVNTDFAETEVDSRRVNLTRFPLFFPEKRDFFLQDRGIFEFGGIRRSPLPFFSRRIGLADGEEIPILVGARVTGRAGPYSIGVLDVQTGEEGEIGSKNLFVTRVSKNILEQSQFGIIATRGNPTEKGNNALGGADFTYRTSSLFEDKNLRFDGYVMTTATSGKGGDGPAWGLTLNYPNDKISTRLSWTHIDQEFNPALGFVSRRGINRYVYDFRYRPRFEKTIRRLTFGVNPQLTTSTSNHLLSRGLEFTPFGIVLDTGDELSIEIENMREVLVDPFEIQDGIIIPSGTYDFTRYQAEVSTGSKRPISIGSQVEWGTFFSGKRFDWSVEIEARPSKYLTLGLENEENRVALEEGRFITRVVRGRIDLTFTPELSWNNFVQFDNQSHQVGWNSRVRWIIEPGRELKFVVNQSWDRRGSSLKPLTTKLTTKLEYGIRF